MRGRLLIAGMVLLSCVALPASPAAAALEGSISGHVRDLDGDPVPGACVNASSGDFHSPIVETDANGAYTIGQLEPGDYTVVFYACEGFPYEYWQGARTPGEADPVTVGPLDTVTGIDGTLALPGAITGTVRDAHGDSIAGICVQASRSDGYGARGTTGPDGRYSIDDLDAGAYVVRFHACDWSEDVWLPETFDDRPGYGDGDPVVVRSAETTGGIDAVLKRPEKVSGRVTDRDGNPLAGICVNARQKNPENPMHESAALYPSTRTDGDGRYVLGDSRERLQADRPYAIEFRDCNPSRVATFAGQFWPGAPTLDDATDVVLASGEHRTGIDAQLSLGGQIFGTARSEAGEPLNGVCVTPERLGGGVGLGISNLDGRWRTGVLEPGEYVVSMRPCPPPGGWVPPSTGRWPDHLNALGYEAEYWQDSTTRESATVVRVEPGSQVGSLDAVLDPGPTARCVVPELEGRALRKAKRRLDEANCDVGSVEAKRGRSRRGRVADQSPGSGKIRRGGADVDLVLRRR